MSPTPVQRQVVVDAQAIIGRGIEVIGLEGEALTQRATTIDAQFLAACSASGPS